MTARFGWLFAAGLITAAGRLRWTAHSYLVDPPEKKICEMFRDI
jgi:hypothetical protein